MDIQEIKLDDLVEEKFIEEQVAELKKTVGDGVAINALSGGVDSSVVTLIAHKALGDNLKTYFIENGIMREGEPEYIVSIFKDLGVKVELIDAKEQFFGALKGLTDPEEKREAITQTFYKDVFSRLVKDSPAQHPRAAGHRHPEGVRLQGARAHHPAAQDRRAQGRQGSGPARRALQPPALPRPGPGRPDRW
jgi:3'-phosphoadenosine 5'-phosphosulfate sulfotransferase (PAPS reductase)/FAD synthetase